MVFKLFAAFLRTFTAVYGLKPSLKFTIRLFFPRAFVGQIKNTLDRRKTIQDLAIFYGENEQNIAIQLSDYLGYQFLATIPNLFICSESLDFNKCVQNLTIPVLKNNIFHGIATCNPDFLTMQDKQDFKNIYLVTYQEFQKSLLQLKQYQSESQEFCEVTCGGIFNKLLQDNSVFKIILTKQKDECNLLIFRTNLQIGEDVENNIIPFVVYNKLHNFLKIYSEEFSGVISLFDKKGKITINVDSIEVLIDLENNKKKLEKKKDTNSDADNYTISPELGDNIEEADSNKVIVKDIALIDDSLAALSIIKNVVTEHEYTCDKFGSVFEFLSKNNTTEYRLIISDLDMPNLTGFDLLLALKKESVDIPVIIWSSDSSYESKMCAEANGAAAFIPKNCDSNVLLKLITKYIQK